MCLFTYRTLGGLETAASPKASPILGDNHESCSLASLQSCSPPPSCSLTGLSSPVAIFFCLHNLCWGLPELASCLRFPSLANFTRFLRFFSLKGFAPPSLRDCGWKWVPEPCGLLPSLLINLPSAPLSVSSKFPRVFVSSFLKIHQLCKHNIK